MHVGDLVRVYVSGYKLSDCVNSNTLDAMIIAKYRQMDNCYLLGWKEKPSNLDNAYQIYWDLDTTFFESIVPNKEDYKYGHLLETLKDKCDILKSSFNNVLSCKICKDPYPYATPNQADGSLICYSCRTQP